MMTTPKQNSSDILRALSFPSAGDDLNGTKVVSSKHSFQKDSILRYQIVFPKGTKAKEVPSLLKTFFNTQLLEGEHNMMVKHHDYTVKPHEGNVAVVGAMHIVPIAYANPGAVEFDEDYSKMAMSNPETYFRRFDVKGFSGSQFRAKLFSLVSYMGENYGYCDGDGLYHRRASLIMPKIKITKAVKDAKVMYHTHPKKDEPSLSSADDYLLYFDLSHEPRSVRDFYTVMKDRMDHFKITPKKGSKENYLKLSEDKFLDEVNAKMEELEVEWTKKIPKEGATPQDDLEFCEGITKDLVAWMNKKYGKFFSIKYKCYYKVRQNPPAPESQDLHLNDEFLKKALVEVNSGDYSWPEFKADTQPHENYAYWHQRYYTEHVRDSFMTLGVNVSGNNTRRQNRYFQGRFGDSIIANIDALNILNLSYDISKADGKIRDGTGYMSRLDDLCDYLELSGEVCDDLKLLEQVIHSGDVFSENAKTLAGDYYALVLLSFYSIQAIEIMKRVNSNEMDFDKAKYEVYSKLKQQVGGELDSFLVKTVELPERGFVAAPVDTVSNPPVYFKKVEAYTNYPPEAFELADILVDAFDEPGNSFNPERVDIKKKMFGAKQMVLYVPTEQGRVTVMIYRSTGRAQMQGPSMEACAEAAKKINQQLYKYGARGVSFDDEFDISEKSYAKNPSKAQVITVSGPSGSGKSTTIRTLLKMLPNSKTAPTVTTRQKRKSDKPGERIFVTTEQFKKMSAAGELIAVQLQHSGNYYGRRKEDFEDASYVIVDVSLKGVNQIKSVFPGAFTIFLEPVEDPETIRQRILRRGDISAQEAAGRASIIPQIIAASKKMEFDARIQTQQGKFDYAAQKAYELIPKKNPDHDSGKLTDLHMLAKYTVEELENDNDLPTVAECAASVTKENYIGGGAFGKVFRIPGTDYLFKVNNRHDEKVFKELTKYLDGKSKTFTYPTEGVTRYRVDYRIPFECGQPRAWLRREGGGSEPDTIMNNLEGFTIATKIPQARYAKADKARFKAMRGEVPYYTVDKIKEYYQWVEEVSKIPQESINQTVSEMQYLISRGVPQDIHSGNMIYNPKTKKVTITDWFWDEKAVGKSVITNAPTLTGIFERVTMINWVRTMTDYFAQHHKKPVQKEAVEAFKAGVGKAMRQALEYFEKCLKAFEANNVSPSKTDYTESFFRLYKYETETYVSMIRRVLSEGFPDYWYDFDEVQRADAVAISNPDEVPKKQITLEVGETLEERAERDKRLAENKKEIEEEEERLAAEIAEREARFKQTELPRDNPMEVSKEQLQLDIGRPLEDSDERTLVVYGDVYNLDKGSVKGSNVQFGDRLSGSAIKAGNDVNTGTRTQIGGNQANDESTQNNPKRDKPTLEEFRKWVELVNMKNKELKAFYDSDWFAASGLTPEEAKAQGIKSGQDSFRAIIRMRKKLGLTGPKDYIKAGPQITKRYYEMALEEWTGPDNKVSALDDRSDWGWMKRQIRFNGRASAFPYNAAQEKRKGPLVKKQKTQNQPSRKLLSLWVWGHDPWRWARKHGVTKMPKCPDVPWVGMTEKRKYGKIPVIMGPRSNPGRGPRQHHRDRRRAKDDFNVFAGREQVRQETQKRQIEKRDFKGDPPRYKLQNGKYYFADFTRSPTRVVTTHFIYRYFTRKTSYVGESVKAVHAAMDALEVDGFGELRRKAAVIEKPTEELEEEAEEVTEERTFYSIEDIDKMFRLGFDIIRAAGYLRNDPLARRVENKNLNYIHLTTYLTRNPGGELENPPTTIGTGSPKKVAEYKALLGEGYTYDDQYDLPEVVGDPKTVIIHKAALAYKVWGKPVIVEDTTLHIEGMSLEDASNIKWMVDDLPDHVGKKAVERVSIAYADGTNVYAYVGRTDGKLVTRRGTKGFAHDFYFMPKGSTKTYAEEKKISSRTKAIEKFVADKPDFAVDMPEDWTGAWQENYTPEDMLKKNPSKTPDGRKIPKRYLKGLNKEEMIIAAKEIDKGYKYDINDPKAYEFWKSDIKATARGYKTVPSKYKKKFIKLYGPLPEKGSFIEKMSKATGIKKSILKKVYDKGLAAWRGGHRPGVQQHQWAAGRVYSFVTLGNTVKKGNKKMPDYSLAVKAGLIKDNPKEVDAYVLVNGSRQGAINWMRDNKWEYGFDDDVINMVEEDERIPSRLIQWFVREASKGNIQLPEDTEGLLSNWAFLKDKMGDQTVVKHIKEEYEIKTPKNVLLYSSGDLNGIANWYHSLFEKPALPEDYFELLDKYPTGSELVGQTKDWLVIKLTSVDATVAFTNLRNNSWCVKERFYARQYLWGSYHDRYEQDDYRNDDDWADDMPLDDDEQETALYLILKASGAQYALFHYPSESFLDVDDEPFIIPQSLDKLTKEITGKSAMSAIYKDPEAAFEHAVDLGGRFKEGEEAILTSPEYAEMYARHILKRRWPRAEAVIATDGHPAVMYAIYVTGKRWTEFADTVTAQIAEGTISINPRATVAYAKKFFDGRWKAAEANMSTDPMSAFSYARDVIGGRWPEAEETIAKDGRASYKYASDVLKGRFEAGEKEMFYSWTFHGKHPALTPSESISYAGLAKERIPELEKAIIGEAWGSRQVMENRYKYTKHATIAIDYVIAVGVERIPELEEIIAKEAFESFMYANHLDRPFPKGEEVILEAQKFVGSSPADVQLQKDGWGPGAVAAAYENRFYNGKWPRLRRKLEEYKRKDEKESLEGYAGLASTLYGEKFAENRFIDNYYKAKGVRDNPSEADFFPGDTHSFSPYATAQTIPITALQNPSEWRHGEFAEEDPFEEYF
jgi:guanylate kinase/inosine/xanthosine triphosphate pyrophosphatase family protein